MNGLEIVVMMIGGEWLDNDFGVADFQQCWQWSPQAVVYNGYNFCFNCQFYYFPNSSPSATIIQTTIQLVSCEAKNFFNYLSLS